MLASLDQPVVSDYTMGYRRGYVDPTYLTKTLVLRNVKTHALCHPNGTPLTNEEITSCHHYRNEPEYATLMAK